MNPERFDELVNEAVDSLPEQFARRLDNIEVVVRSRPSRRTRREMGLRGRETLLGLYQGVPQTRRDTSYGGVLPDRIVIYREPILDEADAVCPREASDEEFEETIRDLVRKTVLHEIGHHFGLGEDDLHRLGYD